MPNPPPPPARVGRCATQPRFETARHRSARTTRAAPPLALQVSGNHGLSRYNPLERHYRDVLCSRIHTPQNDSILLAAGRTALGV